MFKKITVHDYDDDQGQSCQIKSVHIHPDSEQRTTWTTAKIQVHEAAYGFEQELKKCIEELAIEASQYVFDGKSNQTSMDFGDDKEEAA